jgi:hypothetical protein
METPSQHHQFVPLKYIKWNDKYVREKPFQLCADIPVGIPNSVRGNVAFEDGPAERILDTRARFGDMAMLDSHGFAFTSFKTKFTEWEDPIAVQDRFYKEIVELLRSKVEDACSIHPFEYRV